MSPQLMSQLLKDVLSWVIDALPDLSNLILVLVGVIMSYPNLADRIEKNKRARIGVALGCLVIGLGGFAGGIYQRHQANSDIRHLISDDDALVRSTNQLVSETDENVSKTNSLLRTIGSLVLQINGLGDQLSSLRAQMVVVGDNERQKATLKAHIDTLQSQYDAATQKLATAVGRVTGAPLPAPTTGELKAMGFQFASNVRDWIASVSKDIPQLLPNNTTPNPEESRKFVDRLNSEWQTRFGFFGRLVAT
jgi:hypothetical protein